MSIFGGSTEVSEIYSGSTEVKDVYSGSDLVWSNVPNINYVGQWNSGSAIAQYPYTRDSAFVSNTAYAAGYLQLNHFMYYGGQSNFIAYGSEFNASVFIPSAGDYRFYINTSAASTSASGQYTSVLITGDTNIGSTGSIGVWSTTGLRSTDFNVTEGATVNIRIQNNLRWDSTPAGASGYMRFNNIYIERL